MINDNVIIIDVGIGSVYNKNISRQTKNIEKQISSISKMHYKEQSLLDKFNKTFEKIEKQIDTMRSDYLLARLDSLSSEAENSNDFSDDIVLKEENNTPVCCCCNKTLKDISKVLNNIYKFISNGIFKSGSTDIFKNFSSNILKNMSIDTFKNFSKGIDLKINIENVNSLGKKYTDFPNSTQNPIYPEFKFDPGHEYQEKKQEGFNLDSIIQLPLEIKSKLSDFVGFGNDIVSTVLEIFDIKGITRGVNKIKKLEKYLGIVGKAFDKISLVEDFVSIVKTPSEERGREISSKIISFAAESLVDKLAAGLGTVIGGLFGPPGAVVGAMAVPMAVSHFTSDPISDMSYGIYDFLFPNNIEFKKERREDIQNLESGTNEYKRIKNNEDSLNYYENMFKGVNFSNTSVDEIAKALDFRKRTNEQLKKEYPEVLKDVDVTFGTISPEKMEEIRKIQTEEKRESVAKMEENNDSISYEKLRESADYIDKYNTIGPLVVELEKYKEELRDIQTNNPEDPAIKPIIHKLNKIMEESGATDERFDEDNLSLGYNQYMKYLDVNSIYVGEDEQKTQVRENMKEIFDKMKKDIEDGSLDPKKNEDKNKSYIDKLLAEVKQIDPEFKLKENSNFKSSKKQLEKFYKNELENTQEKRNKEDYDTIVSHLNERYLNQAGELDGKRNLYKTDSKLLNDVSENINSNKGISEIEMEEVNKLIPGFYDAKTKEDQLSLIDEKNNEIENALKETEEEFNKFKEEFLKYLKINTLEEAENLLTDLNLNNNEANDAVNNQNSVYPNSVYPSYGVPENKSSIGFSIIPSDSSTTEINISNLNNLGFDYNNTEPTQAGQKHQGELLNFETEISENLDKSLQLIEEISAVLASANDISSQFSEILNQSLSILEQASDSVSQASDIVSNASNIAANASNMTSNVSNISLNTLETSKVALQMLNTASKFQNPPNKTIPIIFSNGSGITMLSSGGILNSPHLSIVGEAGPEAVIPLSGANKERGKALWTEAGEMLGLISNNGYYSAENSNNYYDEEFPTPLPKQYLNDDAVYNNLSENTTTVDTPVNVNLGGMNFTFNNDRGEQGEVMTVIRKEMPAIANEMCETIASSLTQVFSNMKMNTEGI